MARKNYVHFRASADLIERIDALTAESPNGNRSEVIRALLYEALGDDATKAAVLQAVFDFSGVRRIIFAKLADKEDWTGIRNFWNQVLATMYGVGIPSPSSSWSSPAR